MQNFQFYHSSSGSSKGMLLSSGINESACKEPRGKNPRNSTWDLSLDKVQF